MHQSPFSSLNDGEAPETNLSPWDYTHNGMSSMAGASNHGVGDQYLDMDCFVLGRTVRKKLIYFKKIKVSLLGVLYKGQKKTFFHE